MNLEEMKQKYDYTLARVGLNVQKGQIVLVEAAIDGYEFTSIFANPIHPYTKSLLSAIPHPNPRFEKTRVALSYDKEDR